MMSREGGSDFAPQESGESRFQERMKAVGLVVRNAFPTNTEVLKGDPPVSPEDTVRSAARILLGLSYGLCRPLGL